MIPGYSLHLISPQESNTWGGVRVAAGLMLSDCILQQLQITAQCPALSQLPVPGDVLQNTLEGNIRLDSVTAGTLDLPCLAATAEEFVLSMEGDSLAQAGESALRDAHSGWATAYVSALQTVSHTLILE